VGQRRGVVPVLGPLARIASDARHHAPRIGRSFPARSSGVRGLTWANDPQGLGSITARRFRAQGFVTEPPWTLRFLSPEAYWFEVRFASQPARVCRTCLLGHAPVATGLLDGTLVVPDTSNATPANALTS
jgi:hypothetical protein